MKKTLILFAHGARDPRWAQPFERLRDMLTAQAPGLEIELAFLEFMQPDLPGLIKRLVEEGCAEVTLVPVFLGQGGHVLRDLPLMVEQLRQKYPALSLNVAEAAGENEQVLNAIAQYCLANLRSSNS
jgi:sirohydrochlorin cobaltochelatase